MLAGGLSVHAAFLIQRRAIDRPPAHTRSTMTTQGAASALILLAGVPLVTIGYHAAHHRWWPISTTTVIPIAAAIVASTLNQRAAAIRLPVHALCSARTCHPRSFQRPWISQPGRHPEPFWIRSRYRRRGMVPEKNMLVNVEGAQELTRQAYSLTDRSVDTWPIGQAGCSHGSSYRR